MKKVYVFGSINVDFVVFSQRFPAIGETFIGDSFARFPGGKGANQAIAAARSGADVHFIGSVGNDDGGDYMLAYMNENHIHCDEITRVDTNTGTALITVAQNNNTVMIVPGANYARPTHELGEVSIDAHAYCLAQLEVPVDSIYAFFQNAEKNGCKKILNTAPASEEATKLFALSDIIIMNELEASFYYSDEVTTKNVAHAASAIREKNALKNDVKLIFTFGANGIYFDAQDESFFIPAHTVKVVDTTGAGDCFCGAFVSYLAANDYRDMRAAIEFGNAAAALCVGQKGAASSMPHKHQTAALLMENSPRSISGAES